MIVKDLLKNDLTDFFLNLSALFISWMLFDNQLLAFKLQGASSD